MNEFFATLAQTNLVKFVQTKTQISAHYDETGTLVIHGPTPIDWLHEICHLVERPDEKAIGTRNWAFGDGSWDSIYGMYVYHSCEPWMCEMRVWTYQASVMQHWGMTEAEIQKIVLSSLIPGARPRWIHRKIYKSNQPIHVIEDAIAWQIIRQRLCLRNWQYVVFEERLRHKLGLISEYQHSSKFHK